VLIMIRNTVIILDLILGLTAVVGGIYLLVGAPRLSREWLERTPFKTYLWPGLAFILVGGSLIAAALLLLAEVRLGRLVSVEAGVVLLGLTAIQLSTVGYRQWLQLAALVGGLAVVVLSLALPAPG
jgi:uncharacterized membrane protein